MLSTVKGKWLLLPCISLGGSARSALECGEEDEVTGPFVKNRNTCGGARQAGSGHRRLWDIPTPDQGKQRTGQKAEE